MALLEQITWQIEFRLGETVDLKRLSEAGAVSPYHMCRVFQQGAGMSVMSYARARRLSVAAKAIASGEESLLNVALDAGYTSHAAFTRAFARCFGVLRSTIRTARCLSTLTVVGPLTMKKDMIVDVAKPELRERQAFRVVGLSAVCSFENTGAIPGLWQAANAREGEIEGAVPGVGYGVCCDHDETGRFRYVAGAEAAGKTEGMDYTNGIS